MTSIIHESQVSGEEISRIVKQIEPSLDGIPRAHGIIALLSLAIIAMYPDITPEDLTMGVKEVSRHICLLLDTQNNGPVPKSQLN